MTESDAINRLKHEVAIVTSKPVFENEQGFLFVRDLLIKGSFQGSEALNLQVAINWLAEQALKIVESDSNGQS